MKKLFIIAAVALVGMASCSKEGAASKKEKAEGKGALALYLNTESETRATNGTELESKVNSLEIWVFDNDGETPDATTPYVSIEEPDFGKFEDDLSEYAPEYDGQYVTKIDVAVGEKYVLVVANAELGENSGSTMEELMALASSKEFALGDGSTTLNNTRSDIIFSAANKANFKGFVMAGQNLEAKVVENTTNTIEVDIYRNVSKISEPTTAADVTVTLDQKEIDEAFGSGKGSDPDYEKGDIVEGADLTFELTGWAVVNGLPKSSAGFAYTANPYEFDPEYDKASTTFPTYGNDWEGWDAGEFTVEDWKTQLAADNGKTEQDLGARLWSNSEQMKEDRDEYTELGNWSGVYSGTDGGDCILSVGGTTPKNVYLYESKPGILTLNGYEGYNADQVIAVIVEGTLSDGDTTVTRYWRVNIRPEEAYHIVRNSEYTFEINTIATPGHATPWEAEEEEPIIDFPGKTVSEFVINVMPWDIKTVGNDQM